MATKKLQMRAALRRGVLVVTAVAAVTTLAACAGGDSGTGGDSGAPSGTLEILVPSAAASDAAFKEVSAAFEAAYPDVSVTFSAVSNDTFPATKSSRLTAGNVDIIEVGKGFGEVPSFAEESATDDVRLAQSGGFVDLTDEDFMSEYTPSVLESQQLDGKQFVIPTGLSYATGVYYNKSIFEEQGLTVPTTWSELEEAIATLSGAGVTPFGIGGKDTWPAGLVMLAGVAGEYPTAADKSGLVADLWDNSTKLTDAGPLAVLEKTQTIYDNAQPNFAGAGYDELPAGFAAGQYAMVVDGTWNQPTIDAAVNGAFDYGYFPIPTADDAADNASLNGKIELQLAVASNGPNQAAALAWMEFFSDPANYAEFVTTSGYSPAQPDIPTSDFLKSIEPYTATFQPSWEVEWFANNKAGLDAVYPFNYPGLAPLGGGTAEKAAQAAQSAWQSAF